MNLQIINVDLSVCQVSNYSQVDLSQPYTFAENTDHEKSLVCPTNLVPSNATKHDDGWRAFRIQGPLDFSLIGILAKIANILAHHQISIFALSTYDTDYVLVRQENFTQALTVLKEQGYNLQHN